MSMARYKKEKKIKTVEELKAERKEEKPKPITKEEIVEAEQNLENAVNTNPKTMLEPKSTLVEVMQEENIAGHKGEPEEMDEESPLETKVEEVSNPSPTTMPVEIVQVQPTPPNANTNMPALSELSQYTLESAKDAEAAVTTYLKKYPTKSFSRKEITDALGSAAKLSTRAKELTAGGSKTGSGKPRWIKNVAWAIQRLTQAGMISKTGKNSYSYNKNSSAAKGNIISSPVKPRGRPKKAVQQPPVPVFKPNIQVTVAPQPAATAGNQSPATSVQVESNAVQPMPTASTPAPPPVVENVVKPTKGAESKPRTEGEMDLSNVIISGDIDYLKNKEIDDKIDALFKSPSSPPIMLVGPAGVGKTIAVEAYAMNHKIPYIEIQATPETSDDQLLGHNTIIDGNVKFEYGILPRAVAAANKYGSCILLIDEFNLLKPEYQTNLNPLMDYRKSIPINERKEIFRLEPGKKLLVIGTMNPSSYAATNELQGAVANRFIGIKTDYASLPVERKILMRKTGVNDEKLITALIKAASTTRHNTQGQPEISTRTLENALKLYKAYETDWKDAEAALKEAIQDAVFNKYDEDATYQTEIMRKFDENLKGINGFKGFAGVKKSEEKEEEA